MKIAPRQAAEFLKNPSTASAVLLYGPDEGLGRERAQAVVAALLGAKPDPMQKTEMSEAELLADPARLADELAALSLMADKRVVVLRDAGDKCTKAIEQALSGCSEPHYLVVQAGELTPRSSLRALFEGGSKLAALACYKDEIGDLNALLRARFAEAGVNIDRDALAFLAESLGNDRQVTQREIEKMILYAGPGGTLGLADTEALSAHNRELSLEAIAVAAADGDVRTLDALLNQAWREGTQAVAVLRSAQRYWQKLYAMKAAVAAGSSPEQAVAGARPPVFFRQVPVVTRHVRHYSIQDLAAALGALAEAELGSKGGAAPTLLASRALMALASRARSRLQSAA